MKVVILAGGLGSRLSEETNLKPKPMVEIGGKPILWHIMKIYSQHGFNDFLICLGYKGYMIKEYFANYFLHQSNVTFDLSANSMEILDNSTEPWKVTLIDTGANSQTGARIKKVKKYLNGETFFLTYGDGLSNIDITDQLAFHKNHGRAMTVTAIQPDGRYGALEIDEQGEVKSFLEKPKGDGAYINGGFFVCESSIFDYIPDGENADFEVQTIPQIAENNQLSAYKHDGFWKCMDTLRDKRQLENLLATENAKWLIPEKITTF